MYLKVWEVQFNVLFKFPSCFTACGRSLDSPGNLCDAASGVTGLLLDWVD